jgi:hypothetical protein
MGLANMWHQSVQHMLLFSPNLSSPLLSFVLPMMILSNPLHDMDYELMINTCEELGIIPSALRPVFFCQLCGNCCYFFANSSLSSPLLCFASDEIVQVHLMYGL